MFLLSETSTLTRLLFNVAVQDKNKKKNEEKKEVNQ